MIRAAAAAVRADLEATESPHALLGFLTITHPLLAPPIRIVSDIFDYEMGGANYKGLPFEVEVLNDSEAMPEARLRVQNIDRRIGEALLAIRDRARVKLEVISAADFDLTVEPRVPTGAPAVIHGFDHLELVDVEANPIEVTGRLILRDYAQEPCGLNATQSRCPGLFR